MVTWSIQSYGLLPLIVLSIISTVTSDENPRSNIFGRVIGIKAQRDVNLMSKTIVDSAIWYTAAWLMAG